MHIPHPLARPAAALALLFCAGCSAVGVPAEDVSASARGLVANSEAPEADMVGHFFRDGDLRARTENLVSEPEPPRDRKMVYAASYSVLVSLVDDAIRRLQEQTREAGGYLSKREDTTLTVRVPADKFAEFTKGLADYGRILSESMSARDVTSEHLDLSIRLENAETSRKRLLALLDKATKVEDILKIEAELRRLTAEIETMKGQLKLLDNQIAFSTVTVTFKSNAPRATPKRGRANSRFTWINRIGIEQDLRRFAP